jgi:hypothetical protein
MPVNWIVSYTRLGFALKVQSNNNKHAYAGQIE